MGLVKPSAPSDPPYDWDSQGAHLPQTERPGFSKRGMSDFFPSPGCPASQFGGRRGRGPTEEGKKAPEHAWSPESGPGGNPCLQTPLPVKDVKKKKNTKNLFCLFVSPPPLPAPWPPQTACASAAHPVSGFPLLLQSPRGPGILDTGVGEGCGAGEETASSPACAGLGQWVWRGGAGVLVEGRTSQTKMKQRESVEVWGQHVH